MQLEQQGSCSDIIVPFSMAMLMVEYAAKLAAGEAVEDMIKVTLTIKYYESNE